MTGHRGTVGPCGVSAPGILGGRRTVRRQTEDLDKETGGLMTQVAEQPGSSAGRLGSVGLDCPDPLELARFYSAIFGLDIDEHGDDDWRSLTGPGSTLGFRRSEDYVV